MIKTEYLTVKYNATDTICALNNISFSLASGEKVAVIGANGAGKSTLLLTLCGVLDIFSGTVSIDGTALKGKTLPTIRQKIGMLFQNPDDQLFMPTVYEDIAFAPRNYGLGEDETKKRATIILEKLGITHLEHRLSHKLSGGEKRLVTLAGILITEPFALLMDEPSSYLDPKARRGLIKILQSLPQTLLIATHDLDLALEVCSQAIILKEGVIVADDKANIILRNKTLLENCGLELPLSLGDR